jgi:hypothetical protein
VIRRALLATVAALVVTGVALADPLDPKVKIVKADQAHARAAVLKRSDLGMGWINHSGGDPSLKAPICPSLRPNYSKMVLTGHAESVFDIGNGGITVTSDVEIWKTERQATQHMNALLKPALPTCIRYSVFKTVGTSETITLLKTKARKLGKFADVGVSYRVPIAIKQDKQTVVVNSDFILMRKGRAEIYINVIAPSTDEAQLRDLENRVARKVASRVRF